QILAPTATLSRQPREQLRVRSVRQQPIPAVGLRFGDMLYMWLHNRPDVVTQQGICVGETKKTKFLGKVDVSDLFVAKHYVLFPAHASWFSRLRLSSC
ncbi:hypothetical protein, partial [uncultured Sphingomonas sp.]|uniref:hypothetical protein n=1 Tax=uncultured Sphingomonas sp. TaxID=158754 RepID=UPI0035CB3705